MKTFAALLLTALTTGCALAAEPGQHPKAVLVIRHAEKPDSDDFHLSPAGKERAGALTGLFQKTAARPDSFPAPDVIFAAGRSTATAPWRPWSRSARG